MDIYHRITEFRDGKDLKDYPVQASSAKAQSRQDDPAPCPDEPLKC